MKKDHDRIAGAGLRDGAGHLPAGVAASLRARSREEVADERAFFRLAHSDDPLAERLGESFLVAATGGEDASLDLTVEAIDEVDAGRLVETPTEAEFALPAEPFGER